MIPCESHLETVGRKNSLITGKIIQQSQALGGAATCCDPVTVRGGRHTMEENQRLNWYFSE